MATASLLIVHPDEFFDPAVRLMRHKRATGMPANSYSLARFIAGVPGADDAAKLKRAIFDATRDARGVRYVLLLGDGRHLPARYRRTPQIPGFNGNPYAAWYTAADLYYANLYLSHQADGERAHPAPGAGFSDWDANGDGFYDDHHWANDDIVAWNPDQVDGCPDVAVGRVPAHTLDDANTFVNKVIAYETGPGAPPTIAVIAEKEYESSADMVNTVIDTSGIGRSGLGVRKVGYGYPPGSTLPQGFTATPVESAAQEGVFLLYLGHGGVNCWGHGDDPNYDSLFTTQVASFSSGTLPMVISIGCSTAAWVPGAPDDNAQGYRDVNDVEHDVSYSRQGDVFTVTDRQPVTGATQTWTISDNTHKVPVTPPNEYDLDRPSPSFATGWLFNREGGGVGFCGETTVGPDNFGADFGTGLLKAWHGSGTVLGDMWLYAGQRYWTMYKDSNDSIGAARLYLTYMTLLGDPSLRLKLRPADLPPSPSPHTTWTSRWTPGWTSIVPVTAAGSTSLVSYKSASGRISVDRVQPDGSGTTAVWGGAIPTGYTSATSVFLGTEPFVIFYNAGSGDIAFNRVQVTAAVAVSPAWSGRWTTGWTSIVPISLGGHPHLFEYKSGDGTVAIDRINDAAQGTTEIWRGSWSTGWTSIVPISVGGHPHLFEYKSGDGTVAIDRIDDAGQGTTEIWRGSWTPGWSTICYLPLLGDLLEYKPDGTVAIDRLDPHGLGSREIWRSTWETSLTTVTPLVLPSTFGVAYCCLRSNDVSGTVSITRIATYRQPT